MGLDCSKWDYTGWIKKKYGSKGLTYANAQELRNKLEQAFFGKLCLVLVPDVDFGQVPTFVSVDEGMKLVREANPSVPKLFSKDG